ncbi:MAG: hydroxymethylglutaryl-CoA synthase [Acidobacteria bacterium]|nr:hydroxymethylglutaryl-CoA synthase [Acidobacteriota bacterium]MCG2817265.1 hydroxymethylglutaryl-CoA synthase [Candidatus Aminicenantes bacterium]MBU1475001.1 hydroxymethylglutaryl-CoA synthase [Acidobacteriota bacterium]MBU4202978.1 hydroxymethylglutaryl-CoA synthase [Acidobacteriota bacterium]MBU4254590.1 hydroxymethylglutaryl-CoA synthase [Acidobacteriota bacterium]
MVGIIGYGAYIPRNRIKVEEIAKVWGTDAPSYKRGLMLEEKSVPAPDQDTITMSVEASRRAIRRAGINPAEIGAAYIGSESHPYAVKPSGTVLAEALGATPECHTADLEFACKAGTECMFIALSLVEAGRIKYGLGVGADTSQGAPGDALEYSAAAGAAAFIFGKENCVAVSEETYAYMTDMPDFWRREYQYYPQHGGRFTGEPAYFTHITAAARGIMKKSGTSPEDFAYVIFHQPNGKFPFKVGQILGFNKAQIEPGWLVNKLGNTYSGSSPLGLTSTLDIAKPGDRILLVSYGSGAGSDAFIWKVTDRIDEVRDLAPKTRDILDTNKKYLEYGEYAKFRHKILKAE